MKRQNRIELYKAFNKTVLNYLENTQRTIDKFNFRSCYNKGMNIEDIAKKYRYSEKEVLKAIIENIN